MEMKVGAVFVSFNEVKHAVSEYEKEKFVNFYISDSRKLQQAQKNAPNLVAKANDEVVYYYVHYSCINGGRRFASRSKGGRPNQSTFKQGCPAKLRFKCSKDGQSLELTEVDDTHNHVVSQEAFRHLPRQRILDETEQLMAASLLKLPLSIL